MFKINWTRSNSGGWFAIDQEGNYWHRTANRETITVTTQDGCVGTGWTEEQAWNSLQMSVA